MTDLEKELFYILERFIVYSGCRSFPDDKDGVKEIVAIRESGKRHHLGTNTFSVLLNDYHTLKQLHNIPDMNFKSYPNDKEQFMKGI